MTLQKFTLVSFLAFSHLTSAQIINTKGIVKQIDSVERSVERIESQVSQKVMDRPFALSTLPPVDELVTESLTLLPKTLAIGENLGKPIFVEVETEDGWRAIQNQWVVLANPQTKQNLLALGAFINAETNYSGLGLSLLRFTVPESLDSKQALAKHLPEQTLGTLDRNHIYQAQTAAPQAQSSFTGQNLENSPSKALCDTPVKIGMIDSGIDQQHGAFAEASIIAKSFLIDDLSSPQAHGTAVASVLVGNLGPLTPLLSHGKVYSAEVFYRQSDYSQGATLDAMISALNWLVEEQIKVVNMSLAGPPNKMLATIVKAANHQGTIIVAAAGNQGPAAPELYPAGYPEVIAVSAFDKLQQPYRWSNRGDYVDYSALGVNVVTAQVKRGLGKESGTSMAAPVVSAALTCLLAESDHLNSIDRQAILTSLSDLAVDLGPKGRDPIYGIGGIVRNTGKSN
ncbi:MAG: S8 family serine peptidase [Aliiglaciecola sp.]|uniref:S8 family serine peptidase n=1 Tax=Aliiglaciecola sp. TaxID=1872441 RepID=UPI00329A6135